MSRDPDPPALIMCGCLCREGSSPDLLIHEATMEHYMAYDAIIKAGIKILEQKGAACSTVFSTLRFS